MRFRHENTENLSCLNQSDTYFFNTYFLIGFCNKYTIFNSLWPNIVKTSTDLIVRGNLHIGKVCLKEKKKLVITSSKFLL